MELKISLDEYSFTDLCKSGYITKNLKNGRTDITFTNKDIVSLSMGDIVTKEIDSDRILVIVENVDSELIAEIIKRSPIFNL
jgi:hypothetical protein